MWDRIRGNLALIGAVALLVWAAARPTLKEREYQTEVLELASLVTDLSSAAERQLTASGQWPDGEAPGIAPEGTSGAFGGDSISTRHATVQWRQLTVSSSEEIAPPNLPPEATARADSVTGTLVHVPRTVGAIVVHSADERLLAEMLSRHGPTVSFVSDTTWTLVLAGEPPPGG